MPFPQPADDPLLEDFDDEVRQPLRLALRREGYELAADGGISRTAPGPLALSSMAGLRDPAAIIDNLDRMQHAVATDDSALIIGSAKELIESTAKTVLTQVCPSMRPRTCRLWLRRPCICTRPKGLRDLTATRRSRRFSGGHQPHDRHR